MLVALRGGEELHQSSRAFSGWLFKNDAPDWVLQVKAEGFSLHAVRPGVWPHGAYVGWETILSKFVEVFECIAEVYRELPLRRVGLRYLNRIAIPEEEEVTDWLGLSLDSPPWLRETFSFNITQTWGQTSEDQNISVTIRLAKIAIEDPKIAESNQGVLLDIDVFNLRTASAPPFDEVKQWLQRAHSVENRVFEYCITSRLRDTFEEATYAE